jgi:mannosyltransferase OCH1-like enzyme
MINIIKPLLIKRQIRKQNSNTNLSNNNLSNNYQPLYKKNIPKLMKTTINNVKLLKIKLSNEMYLKNIINKPYPLKQNYNSVIPLNIFQTWHTKNLPPLMADAVNKIKLLNPRFNYELFDDNDCREFIEKNFPIEVLKAYDSLIPGAYKADLWRYCILYKRGGIYLDIKYIPHNGFRFISLTEKEHFVLDIDKTNIYNALMVTKANNEILLKAIYKIINNVNNKFYGSNCLEPTGPKMLKEQFNNANKNMIDMNHKFYLSFDNRFILFHNYHILKSYNGYINESSKFQKTEHYSSLWNKRQIYR